MDKVIRLFENELMDEAGKLPETLSQRDVPRINIMGGLAASYLALKDIKKSGRMPVREEAHKESWKNDITEELESAAEKYAQYKQSGDPVMLDMARQELEHASYYINRAKMSADEKMREKLPEYEAEYERLEKLLKEPHGDEKLPVL